MQTYWDLSEKDRAALSREDVERYQDFELMQKGVLKAPEQPELVPVPARPVPTQAYALAAEGRYAGLERGTLCFFDAAPAKAAMSGAFVMSSDYELGHKALVARPAVAVQEVLVYTEDQATKFRSILMEIKAAEERNARAVERHKEVVRKQEDALKGLWDDWHSCRERNGELQSIVDTFQRYKDLAGDPDVAAKFLREAFSRDEIAEAATWFGIHIPGVEPIAAE
jgi:hypothetical protein